MSLPSNLCEVFCNSFLFSPFSSFSFVWLLPSVAPSFEFMINSVATVFMSNLALNSALVVFDHIASFTCRTNENKAIFLMIRMFD